MNSPKEHCDRAASDEGLTPNDSNLYRENYLQLKQMIALRDHVIQLCSAAEKTGNINVHPQLIPNRESAEEITLLCIDCCEPQDSGYKISGWAVFSRHDPSNSKILVEMEGPARYLAQATSVRREDVAQTLAALPELASSEALSGLADCGFSVSIATQTMLPGKYQIRVWIVNDTIAATGSCEETIHVSAP